MFLPSVSGLPWFSSWQLCWEWGCGEHQRFFQDILWPLPECDCPDIFLQYSWSMDRRVATDYITTKIFAFHHSKLETNSKTNFKFTESTFSESCINSVTKLTKKEAVIWQSAAGASARRNLHDRMLQNLFRCSMELFEAYPIGRILNRLSCDMYVIDQVGEEKFSRKDELYLFLETTLVCSETGSGFTDLSLFNCS